jgi:hypothetical protein
METYIIKKGRHYANFKLERLWPFTDLAIRGEVMLSKECWYPEECIKHSGWNKIRGIGQIFGVHTNSGRLGFQANTKKEGYCTIAGYWYTDGGDWNATVIKDIKVEQWYPFIIDWNDGEWFFSIDNSYVTAEGSKPFCPVQLNPYFGGEDKAYNTMKFYFK